MDARLLNTAVDDICHELAGTSGTILARPFMGISTLLRLLVVEDIENKNSSVCPVYITADDFYPYVLAGRGIKNYLTDLILDAQMANTELRSSILSQVEELDQEKAFTIFMDDLWKLTEDKRTALFMNLSFSPSVYYAVHSPTDLDTQVKGMARSSKFMRVELVDLDEAEQASMAKGILRFLKREDDYESVLKRIFEFRRDPCAHDLLSSPLGVLAFVLSVDSSQTMRTRTALSVLNEILVRRGFEPVDICKQYGGNQSYEISALETFSGWITQCINFPRGMQEDERLRLSWPLNVGEFEIFEKNDLIRLLDSDLFRRKISNTPDGLIRTYCFSLRDLALFFISEHIYRNEKSDYADPYHHLWYANKANPKIEAEVNIFLKDLKEFLRTS
jgi:hypothetical protein